MDELPRSSTPVGSQAINPDLLQQILVALANLQVQASQTRDRFPRDPKVPDVPMFNGNKNLYSVFLARLQNFFSLQPNTYDTDTKKIGYVISRLEGSAADWAVTVIENPTHGNNIEILNDWDAFLLAFTKFSDPFVRRNSTNQLLNLKQGKSQSVLSYWTKFSELLFRSDISPDSARPIFERGLKFDIREKLVDKNLSDDLDEFVNAVVDLDNRLYHLKQDRRNSSAWFNPPEIPQQQSLSTSMPQPMDIGKVEIPESMLVNGVVFSNSKERLDQIRAMEPEMRKKVCMEEHRCHYCKRVVGTPPSHLARDCPFKTNKPKSDYVVVPEVVPQKGVPDEPEGIPQRQVYLINFIKDENNSLLIKKGQLKVEDCAVPTDIMFDSGAMGVGYIDSQFVKNLNLKTCLLHRSIEVKSIDGTACGSGEIRYSVRGEISWDGFAEEVELFVIESPRHPLVLGYQWFKNNNPCINWRTGDITFTTTVSQNSLKIPKNCKRVTFDNNDSVRWVENYIKSMNLAELGCAVTLPENSAAHITLVPTGAPSLNNDSIYLSVNSLFKLAEEDDSLMVGIVKGYEVVPGTYLTDNSSNDLFQDFKDVFSETDFPELPPHRPGVDLSIDLVDGKTAPFGPIYSLSAQEELVLQKYLEGALAAGIIRESRSSAGAPVMFVPKPGGGLRLCVDYRGLNNVTKTNRTALPIIKDMLFRTNGSKYFSKIDLKSAFNLIRIIKGHEHLTAFRTKYGHYEYLVMPFGLKNAPGTFQGLMNSIFSDLLDRGLLVYIDDLLVYSVSKEEHKKLLVEVFNRLRMNNLKANPEKCSLYQSEVKFLGHIINGNGVLMDPDKVDSIKNWKIPTNVKELQSFLGLCNYYRDFIPGFARIAGPLYKLTKKDLVYSWDTESQEAFDALKLAFAIDLILIQPDVSKQFFLECDASDYALGAVLSQLDHSGVLRPIGFFSRKFTTAEVNYEIYDKELLAIIEGLKNWRHYCIGTELPVQIYTDHNNLRYFMSSRQLNRRQARWSLFLADFNFEIVIRPGAQQVVSDALSRQESMQIQQEDEEFKINEQTLLTEDKFILKERSSNLQDASLTVRSEANEYPISREVMLAPLSLATQDAVSEEESASSEYEQMEEAADDSEYSEESSVYGDMDQLAEVVGLSENGDPMWFRHLLNFLWTGYIPMVLPISVIHKLKKII